VAIEKTFEGKQPITYIALTGEGRDVLKDYWKRFDQVRKGLRRLKPLRVSYLWINGSCPVSSS
jgi:hypothetical protein